MEQPTLTTNHIQLLPEVLSNQIAAGEVVERPASVVKELVENALDAGANRIFIDVEDGGRARIKVVDDGSGMSRSDASMAVLRHATSKITSEADLHAIGTLGFRGEALPSIASVSRFTLTTRTKASSAGTRLVVDGGIRSEPMDVGAPIGTTIDVKDLFYNVPARLKFMKSKGTEMTHINHLITGFALGHPHVHFRLTNNGRKTADYPKERNLKARIYSVLGSKACSRLYETVLEADIQVRGFLSDPGYTRAGTQGVYTFINGRQVRDKLLLRAITASFGNTLERGRYPHAVLYLSVPVEWVDVNVHPTKHEVRFVQSGRVFECVTRALKMTLEAAPWKDMAEEPLSDGVSQNLHLWREPSSPAQQVTDVRPELPRDVTEKNRPTWAPTGGHIQTTTKASPSEWGFEVGAFRIAPQGDEVVVVHQERAMGYLIHQELKSQRELGEVPRQRLLFPEQFEINKAQCHWLENHAELLPCGFVLEPFGETTAVLKEIPLPLAGGGTHTELIHQMIREEIDSREDLLRMTAEYSSRGEWATSSRNKLERAFQQGEIPALAKPWGTLFEKMSLDKLNAMFSKGRT